jgi:hypothetical protein
VKYVRNVLHNKVLCRNIVELTLEFGHSAVEFAIKVSLTIALWCNTLIFILALSLTPVPYA